ncbi:MAG: translation elongation factor Ts [Myxococcota bacterium]|jgi:elongation factor Ts|nr:translation elongation factor Ts [Myxococcota bacterium]
MQITAGQIQELRGKTGAGIMDCKKALAETSGDLEGAVDFLRKKGMAAASKKASRIAAEGLVGSYIHGGGKIGVMVEINCETDFVARNTDFQGFVKDVAMHVAAANPSYVSREEVPTEEVDRERGILSEQVANSGKPAEVVEKIVTGRLDKFFKEICLLEQPFVKDPDKSVELMLNELVGTIGEKISIRRFARFALGEGLEKRSEDFAAEVAKAASGD